MDKSSSSSQTESVRSGNFLDEFNLNFSETRQRLDATDDFFLENDADSWEAESSTSAFYEVEQTFREYFVWEPANVRATMGHQISNMLLQCSFAGGTCRARNFTRLQTTDYGNCYTIQYPKFISRKSGPKDGLVLKLFLESDEYVRGIASSRGIQVIVHDQGTLPFPDEEGIAVKSGSETRIGLRRLQISRLGKPFGECTPIEEFKKQYGVKYTRTACQNFCRQERTTRTCGCYDIEAQETNMILKLSRNWTACKTAEEIQCALRLALQLEADQSVCGCHSPCKHEFLKLVVYYEDLNYEELEESAAYQIDQFLSDVGGTIGLWIGLSVLSLFEIVHLLTDIGLYLCRGGRKPKSAQERDKKKPR
ncbi:amiloride-sensitive sodium channel subunit gamma [Plakobranchus ocellatus]|uniref:Amiloride-sensitive sodium channel subunit gamma n=1 Tax=Plakobranchus ocellatus TaxID=259542 RepID=A0AAV3XPR2_9GAST|nr:amiloride-sensitive sodium channel subunit gamma [Plakobranchus ocellatus]